MAQLDRFLNLLVTNNGSALVLSEGEILDGDELPGLEMPYGFFRPVSGVRACADGWLRGESSLVLTGGPGAGKAWLLGRVAWQLLTSLREAPAGADPVALLPVQVAGG